MERPHLPSSDALRERELERLVGGVRRFPQLSPSMRRVGVDSVFRSVGVAGVGCHEGSWIAVVVHMT